jgi:hypothetical protein
MRTKVLCTSCEEYVYTDADHSCRDAKALRAVRDAEAAVVEAAERIGTEYSALEDGTLTVVRFMTPTWAEFVATIRALHAARQGEG